MSPSPSWRLCSFAVLVLGVSVVRGQSGIADEDKRKLVAFVNALRSCGASGSAAIRAIQAREARLTPRAVLRDDGGAIKPRPPRPEELSDTHWIGKLASKIPDDRRKAAVILGERGGVPGAMPALTANLTDENPFVRKASREAVAKIVSTATLALRDTDPGRRAFAAEILRTTGAEAKSALPALLAAMEDRDRRVRAEAAAAAGRLDADSPQVTAALREALKDQSATVRSHAALGLGFGAKAVRAALPELLEATYDPDWRVRSSAASAVGSAEAGPEAAAAVKALTSALADRHPDVRASAASALESLGPAAKPAISDLLELLGDREPPVRVRAAQTLWVLAARTEALPALAEAMASDDAEASKIAVDHLTAIGPPAAPAVPAR